MNINFPPVDEKFIKAKVEAGYYSNATELVRDAVRRLRENDKDAHARLMAALQAGEDSLAKHGGIPYTPELLENMVQEAYKHVAEGRGYDPDVIP